MPIAKKCSGGASSRRAQPARPSSHPPMLDALEPRLFLSTARHLNPSHFHTHRPHAHHVHPPQPIQAQLAHVAYPAHLKRAVYGPIAQSSNAQPAATAGPEGLTPAQIRAAYGID